MNIESISINNFLTLSEANLSLEDRGLMLIQGENLDDTSADSNGAGKSTVADALSWCLYGVTARGVAGDAVINREAKKGCRVSLVVSDNSGKYVVSRHRKHKQGKNRVTVFKDSADLTGGTDKLTQETINKIMGCTYDVFKAAIYSGQEDMPNLPGMTDRELKVVVEQSAGIEKIESAYDIARSKMNAHDTELRLLQTQLETAEQQLADRENDLKLSKKEQGKWTVGKTLRVDKLKENIALAEKGLKALMDGLNKLGDRADLNGKLNKIDSKIKGFDDERKQERTLSSESNKANNAKDVKKADVERGMKDMKLMKQSIVDIDKRVGTSCGECGKEYREEDLKDAKSVAVELIKKKADLLKEQSAELGMLVKASEDAQEQLKQYRASMTDVSKLNNARTLIQRRIDDILGEAAKTTRQREYIEQENKRLDELKAEENPHVAAVKRVTEQIEKLTDGIAQLNKDAKESEKQMEVFKSAVEVFSPKGVRAYLLDTVTPFLNDRSATYLGTLSDGNLSAVWSTIGTTAKGEAREKFNINVSNMTGADSFAGLSGGEKRKVRLACAMALQDLVASRATKPISLWMGDEIDDALDKSGLERLMTILDEKAKEKGTVLIISHNELSDWVSQVVTVTKEGGSSTLREG